MNKWRILLTLLMFASTALPVSAQDDSVFERLPVTGLDENEDTFTGFLSIYEFSYEDGLLRVDGILTYEDLTGGSVAQTFEDLNAELTYQDHLLVLELEPLYLTLLEMVVDLAEITFDLAVMPDRSTTTNPDVILMVRDLADDMETGGSLSIIQGQIDDINTQIQLPLETPSMESTSSVDSINGPISLPTETPSMESTPSIESD